MPHSQPPSIRRTIPSSSPQQSDHGTAQGSERLIIATVCGFTFRVLSLDVAENRAEVRPTTRLEHELFLAQHASSLRGEYQRGEVRDSQTAAEVILMQLALQPGGLMPVTTIEPLPHSPFQPQPPMDEGAVFIPGPSHDPAPRPSSPFAPQDQQPSYGVQIPTYPQDSVYPAAPQQRPSRTLVRRPKSLADVPSDAPEQPEFPPRWSPSIDQQFEFLGDHQGPLSSPELLSPVDPQPAGAGAPPPPPPSTGTNRVPADSQGQPPTVVDQILFALRFAQENDTPFHVPPNATMGDLQQALIIVQQDTTLIAYQRTHMELMLDGVLRARAPRTPTPPQSPAVAPESTQQQPPAPPPNPFVPLNQAITHALENNVPCEIPVDALNDVLLPYRDAMLAGRTPLPLDHPRFPEILGLIDRRIMTGLISTAVWGYLSGGQFVVPAGVTARDLRSYVDNVQQDLATGEEPIGTSRAAMEDALQQCLAAADALEPPVREPSPTPSVAPHMQDQQTQTELTPAPQTQDQQTQTPAAGVTPAPEQTPSPTPPPATVTPGAPPPPPPTGGIPPVPKDGRPALTPLQQLRLAMIEAVRMGQPLEIPPDAANILDLRTAVEQLNSGELTVPGASTKDMRRLKREVKAAIIQLETDALNPSPALLHALRQAIALAFEGQPLTIPDEVPAALIINMTDRLLHRMEPITLGRSQQEINRVCNLLMDALQPRPQPSTPGTEVVTRMAICHAAIEAVSSGEFIPPFGTTANDLRDFLAQANSPEVLQALDTAHITPAEWDTVLGQITVVIQCMDNQRQLACDPDGTPNPQRYPLEVQFAQALSTGRLIWPTPIPTAVTFAGLVHNLDRGAVGLPEGTTEQAYTIARQQLLLSAGYLIYPSTDEQAQERDVVLAFLNALRGDEQQFIAPAAASGQFMQNFAAGFNHGQEPQPAEATAQMLTDIVGDMNSAGADRMARPLVLPAAIIAASRVGIPAEDAPPINDDIRADLIIAALEAPATGGFTNPQQIALADIICWMNELQEMQAQGVPDLLNEYIDSREIRDEFNQQQLAQYSSADLVSGLGSIEDYIAQESLNQWMTLVAPELVADDQLPPADRAVLTAIATDALRSASSDPAIFMPSGLYTPDQLDQFLNLMHSRSRINGSYLSPRITPENWQSVLLSIEPFIETGQADLSSFDDSDDDQPTTETTPTSPTSPPTTGTEQTPPPVEPTQALVDAIRQSLSTGEPVVVPEGLTTEQLRSYLLVLVNFAQQYPAENAYQRVIYELSVEVTRRDIAESIRNALETGAFTPPEGVTPEELLQFAADMENDLSLGEQLEDSVDRTRLLAVLEMVKQHATKPSSESGDSVFESPVTTPSEETPPAVVSPSVPSPTEPPVQPSTSTQQPVSTPADPAVMSQAQASAAISAAIARGQLPLELPKGVSARHIRGFLATVISERRSVEHQSLPAPCRPASVSNSVFVARVLDPLTAAVRELEGGQAPAQEQTQQTAPSSPSTSPPSTTSPSTTPTTPEETGTSTVAPPAQVESPAETTAPSPLDDPTMAAIAAAIRGTPLTGEFHLPADVTTAQLNLFILQIWENDVNVPGTEHLDRNAISQALRRYRRASVSDEMGADPVAREIINAIVAGRAEGTFTAPAGITAQDLRDFLRDILHKHPRAVWVTATLDLNANDLRSSHEVVQISGRVRAEAQRLEQEERTQAPKPPTPRPTAPRPTAPPPPPPSRPTQTTQPSDGAGQQSSMEQLVEALREALRQRRELTVPQGVTTADLNTLYSEISFGRALQDIQGSDRHRALQLLGQAITTSALDDAVAQFLATGALILSADIDAAELQQYYQQWQAARVGQIQPNSDDARVDHALQSALNDMMASTAPSAPLMPAALAIRDAVRHALTTGTFEVPADVSSTDLRQFVVTYLSDPEGIMAALGAPITPEQRSSITHTLLATASAMDAAEQTPWPSPPPSPTPTPPQSPRESIPAPTEPSISTGAPAQPVTSVETTLAQALAGGTVFIVPVDATTNDLAQLLDTIVRNRYPALPADAPRRVEIVQTLYSALTTSLICDACAQIPNNNGCFVPPQDVSPAELIQYVRDVLSDLGDAQPDAELQPVLTAIVTALSTMNLTPAERAELERLDIATGPSVAPSLPSPPPVMPSIPTIPAQPTPAPNAMDSIFAEIQRALSERDEFMPPENVSLEQLQAFYAAFRAGNITEYPVNHPQRVEVEEMLRRAVSSLLICDAMANYTHDRVFVVPEGVTAIDLREYLADMAHDQNIEQQQGIPGVVPEEALQEALTQVRLAAEAMEAAEAERLASERLAQRTAAWNALSPRMQQIHHAAHNASETNEFIVPAGISLAELEAFIEGMENQGGQFMILPERDYVPRVLERVLLMAQAAAEQLQRFENRVATWNALPDRMQAVHQAAQASVTSGRFTRPDDVTLEELEEFLTNLQADPSGQIIAPNFDPSAEQRDTILRLVAQAIAEMKQAEAEQLTPAPAPPSGPSAPPPPPPPAGGATNIPQDGDTSEDAVLEQLKRAIAAAIANDTDYNLPATVTLDQVKELRSYITTRKDIFPDGNGRTASILRQLNRHQGRMLIAQALTAAGGDLEGFSVPPFVSPSDLLGYIEGIKRQFDNNVGPEAQAIIDALRSAAEQSAAGNRLWTSLDDTMRGVHWAVYDSLATGVVTLPQDANLSHLQAFIDSQDRDPLGFRIVAGWIPTPAERHAILQAARTELAHLQEQEAEQLPPPPPSTVSPPTPPSIDPEQTLRDRLIFALNNNAPFTIPEGISLAEIQQLIGELNRPESSFPNKDGGLPVSPAQVATYTVTLQRAITIIISTEATASLTTGQFIPPEGLTVTDLLRYTESTIESAGSSTLDQRTVTMLGHIRVAAEAMSESLDSWSGLSRSARSIRWAAFDSVTSGEFILPNGATAEELQACIEALTADADGSHVMPGGPLTAVAKAALLMRLRTALRNLKAETEPAPADPPKKDDQNPKPDSDDEAGAATGTRSPSADAVEKPALEKPAIDKQAPPVAPKPFVTKPSSEHENAKSASLPRFQKGAPKPWPTDDGEDVSVKRNAAQSIVERIKAMIPHARVADGTKASTEKQEQEQARLDRRVRQRTPSGSTPRRFTITSGNQTSTQAQQQPESSGSRDSQRRSRSRTTSTGSYTVTESEATGANGADNKDKS